MKRRWLRLVAIGLAAGMLFTQTPVVHAEEMDTNPELNQEIVPDEKVEDEANPDEVVPDEVVPDEETSDEGSLDEGSPDEEVQDEANTDELPADDAESGEETEVPEDDTAIPETEDVMESQGIAATLAADAGYKSGVWIYDASVGKWWFKYSDGTYPKDTIVQSQDGTTYAFDAAGYMITGWHKITEDGEDYYFYFDSSGAMCKGWLKEGATWYYLDKDYGLMYSDGYCEIDGKGYYFKPSGAMVTGWNLEGETWNYYDASGAKKYGWVQVGNTWYYLDPDYGYMHSNREEEIDGKMYRFDASGAMVTGWYWHSAWEIWYYYDASGALYKGWLNDNGKWYYLDLEYGDMYADGWWPIGNTKYVFDKSGVMVTGWYHDVWSWEEDGVVHTGSEWYYTNADGTVYDGWLKQGNVWYYLDDGWMFHDMVENIEGKEYGFNETGAMVTGWFSLPYFDEEGTEHTQWFYFDPSGAGRTGWVQSGGNWYWIEEGQMNTEETCRTDNGTKLSYFKDDGSGIWIRSEDYEPEE